MVMILSSRSNNSNDILIIIMIIMIVKVLVIVVIIVIIQVVVIIVIIKGLHAFQGQSRGGGTRREGEKPYLLLVNSVEPKE